MKTHRELYPDQYEHPLVGKRVRLQQSGREGTVTRVVGSRFGKLAILDGNSKIAFSMGDCQPIERSTP